MIPKYDDSVVIKMFRFFKHRLPVRKFKNSNSTETPVGPGRPSRAWVRTDYNLASVSSKGCKFGVRPVLRRRLTDWTLGNTDFNSLSNSVCLVFSNYEFLLPGHQSPVDGVGW